MSFLFNLCRLSLLRKFLIIMKHWIYFVIPLNLDVMLVLRNINMYFIYCHNIATNR
jgi:hypothetical protein